MRGNPLIRVFFLANELINSAGLNSRAEESGEKKASFQQYAPFLLSLSLTYTHTHKTPEPLLSLFGQLLMLGLFVSARFFLHSHLSHTHTHINTFPLIFVLYCSLVTGNILKDVLRVNFCVCLSLFISNLRCIFHKWTQKKIEMRIEKENNEFLS